MQPSVQACCSAARAGVASVKRVRPFGQRSASTFSYLKHGPAPNIVHQLVFDENKRFEQWKSDTIPRVQTPDVQMKASKEERSLFDKLTALVKEHPETFLVRAMLEKAKHNGYEFPISDAEVEPFLAPATDEEKQAFASFASRTNAMTSMQEQIKEVVQLLRSAESQVLDAGLRELDSPYSDEQAQQLSKGTNAPSARVGLKVLRQISLLHASHMATMTPEERSEAEKVWLSSIGVFSPDAPGARRAYERSHRIPVELWHALDAPLDSNQSAKEVQDGVGYLDYEDTKLMAMEHRDRMEFGSRTALPSSLSGLAPTGDLALAASALESNPSLSREDREYMLQFYADAMAKKPSGFDLSKEKAAFADPQPQWGFYDPALARVQDDAKDVLYGRGRFSEYRGSLFESELTPSSMIGEPPIYGVGGRQHGEDGASGTAPEVVEEAAAHVQSMAARMQAESHMATSAITTALERSMGLKPRNQGAPKAVDPTASFWKRYAAGQRVAGSDPVAPVNLGYTEPVRAPMPTADRAGGGAAAKDAKPKPKKKK